MPSFNTAVVDEVGLPQTDLEAFVAAMTERSRNYVVPFWPEVAGSTIRAVPYGSAATAGEVQLRLVGAQTQVNTLGYHQTTPDGMPIGIVEIEACRAGNVPWQVAASHEWDELSINPALRRFVTVGNKSIPLEVDDPVTFDHFELGGVPLSNMTTPAWWDPNSPADARMDIMGLVHEPVPTIPHNGWLDWSENGVYRTAYGAFLTPDQVAYMRAKKRARRTRLRRRHRVGEWG